MNVLFNLRVSGLLWIAYTGIYRIGERARARVCERERNERAEETKRAKNRTEDQHQILKLNSTSLLARSPFVCVCIWNYIIFWYLILCIIWAVVVLFECFVFIAFSVLQMNVFRSKCRNPMNKICLMSYGFIFMPFIQWHRPSDMCICIYTDITLFSFALICHIRYIYVYFILFGVYRFGVLCFVLLFWFGLGPFCWLLHICCCSSGFCFWWSVASTDAENNTFDTVECWISVLSDRQWPKVSEIRTISMEIVMLAGLEIRPRQRHSRTNRAPSWRWRQWQHKFYSNLFFSFSLARSLDADKNQQLFLQLHHHHHWRPSSYCYIFFSRSSHSTAVCSRVLIKIVLFWFYCIYLRVHLNNSFYCLLLSRISFESNWP